MEQKIIEILNELRPEFNFSVNLNFIEEGMLDSFDVIRLVVELDSTFGVSINGLDIIPDNFSGIGKIVELLQKYGVKYEPQVQ
jgi:acyl carrier protein